MATPAEDALARKQNLDIQKHLSVGRNPRGIPTAAFIVSTRQALPHSCPPSLSPLSVLPSLTHDVLPLYIIRMMWTNSYRSWVACQWRRPLGRSTSSMGKGRKGGREEGWEGFWGMKGRRAACCRRRLVILIQTGSNRPHLGFLQISLFFPYFLLKQSSQSPPTLSPSLHFSPPPPPPVNTSSWKTASATPK